MLTLIWYLVMLYISINLFQSLRVGYCCCCQLDYRTLSSEPLPPTHMTSTITSKSTMTNTSQTTRATAATTSWYLKFLVTYIHCPHDFWLQQPNTWDHRFLVAYILSYLLLSVNNSSSNLCLLLIQLQDKYICCIITNFAFFWDQLIYNYPYWGSLVIVFTALGPRTFDLRPKLLIKSLTRILAVTLKLPFIWWSDTLCIALFAVHVTHVTRREANV